MFLAGPRNGISIRYISEAVGRAYKPVYYMMRGVMTQLANLPRGPGRGTFEKNSPMTTVYHQRATENEPDVTIFDVPRDSSRTLAEMAAGRFEPGSTVMTDEHPAYKSLEERGYDHHTVNHSEGEYASGDHNEIHTNNCECRAGMVKWWLKKHRGVSKWHLLAYVKSFQFVHNHRHYNMEERFVVTLAAVLGQYSGRQAGEDPNLEALMLALS